MAKDKKLPPKNLPPWLEKEQPAKKGDKELPPAKGKKMPPPKGGKKGR